MSAPSAAAEALLERYEAIARHAELELELAGNGDLAGLEALAGRWASLTQGLPQPAPAAAAPVLERARLIHERTAIELARLREALLCDFTATSTARRTADGYAGQLRVRPRVDHSA
jgi:hypothetical protein